MRVTTRQDYQKRIKEAIQFVFDNLDKSITAADVADHICFSRFHFGRQFSRWTGESLTDLMRRLRLERAAISLESDTPSITEVAIDAGYDSLEGFSRAFKEAYTLTPTEYRRSPIGYKLSASSGIHWFQFDPQLITFVFDGEPTMKAEIKQLETQKVIALRHIGPYHHIGEKFGQLAGWAAMNRAPVSLAIALYHDDPESTDVKELRADACLVVPDDYELPPNLPLEIRLDTLAGGDYATVTHKGSYAGLGDAWAQFSSHALPALQRESASGPALEIYLNDCTQVAEAELLTELYVPLK